MAIVVFTSEELVNMSLVSSTIDRKIVPRREEDRPSTGSERTLRFHFGPVSTADVLKDEISSALAEFTEVKSIKYKHMTCYLGIRMGKRLVVLEQ